MLDRERELLDLQEVIVPEEAIEIDTERMGRQLGIQACAEPAEGMGMVRLNIRPYHDLRVS